MGEQGGFDAVALEKYHQVERINHVHHAGNSSGIVDGAAAVLFGSKEAGKAAGLKPRARVRATASIGSEPSIMLTGPADVSRKVLKRAGMTLGDIDLHLFGEGTHRRLWDKLGAHPRTMDGVQGVAFAVWARGREAKLLTEALTDAADRGLLAHEALHSFTGSGGTGGQWYSEGSTSYYTIVLPYRAELTRLEDVQKSFNDLARAYYTNPRSNLANDEVTRLFFSDPDAQVVHLVADDLQLNQAPRAIAACAPPWPVPRPAQP